MRLSTIPMTVSNCVSNRLQMHRLFALMQLPYSDLLAELGRLMGKNGGNTINNNWILRLSARHQCHTLFTLYQSRQTQPRTPTHNSQQQQELKILVEALSQLFNQQSALSLTPHPGTPISMEVLSCPANGHSSILGPLALPQIYPTMALTPKLRTQLKQIYIDRLQQILEHKQDHDGWHGQVSKLPVHRLLPLELFNVCDQPLMKRLYYRHLYPGMLAEEGDRTSILAWLSRFGVQADWYIRKCIHDYTLQAQQMRGFSKQQQLIGSIDMCNNAFIILTKILPPHLPASKNRVHVSTTIVNDSANAVILRSLTELVMRLPTVQMLGQLDGMGVLQMDKHIMFICSSIDNHLASAEHRIRQLQYGLLAMNKIEQQQQHNKTQCINKIAEIKTLRYFLVLLHISIVAYPSLVPLLRTIFNTKHMHTIIANCVGLGDTLAQLLYADQLVLSITNTHLFDHILLKHITSIQQQYRAYLDRLVEGPMANYNNSVMHRYNNLDYLLTGHSRLAYYKHSILNTNPQVSDISILKSLYNDNQFLSNWTTRSFKELMAQQMERNVKLDVRTVTASQYPYFPNFTVTNLYRNSTMVYVSDCINKHHRVRFSQPHAIIDSSIVTNIEQAAHYFQKIDIP